MCWRLSRYVCACVHMPQRERACVCAYLCVFVYQHVQDCRQWDIKIQKRKRKKESYSSAATVYECLNQIIAQAATDCIVEEAAHNIRCQSRFNRFLQGFHTMCLGACHFQLETTVIENTNTSAAYYVSCSIFSLKNSASKNKRAWEHKRKGMSEIDIWTACFVINSWLIMVYFVCS